MKRTFLLAAALASASILPLGAAQAATEIHWWHAFTGRLGELLAKQVEDFNASQSDYMVVQSNKGNYSETLNAGIAAFRAGEQPHILQVFEVGTATMMAAEGAVVPVYEVMAESGLEFDPSVYLSAVTGYYTTPEGKMLSLPYNSSTPVLYINKSALEEAGLDPEAAPATWNDVEELLVALKDAGHECPLTTAWQSWVHLENLSAYHNVPFATKDNGFSALDTELAFNGEVQAAHIGKMGEWSKDGLFIYSGRRNEGGARFRSGECALFTESSAGYAGRQGGGRVPVLGGEPSLLGRCRGGTAEHHHRRRFTLGDGRARGGGLQGRRGVLQLSVLAGGAGTVASGHRLHADHDGRLRAHQGTGLL